MIQRKAGVTGCWHEHRHTLTTELAESGGCDEMVMAIAGHVSRQVLERFSHVWMHAKRNTLDEIDRRRAEEDAVRKKLEAQAQQRAATAANVTPTLSVQ